MFEAITEHGISGRAVKNGLVEIACFNPRDFTEDRHRTVDDRPYGGGPGMVMLIEPLRKAITAAREWIDQDVTVVYLSPQGQLLKQASVNEFSKKENLILIAGRYEGIDERVNDWIDEEISIGDYVLSGGELPAMTMMDCLIRQLPGVLNDDESATEDSFVNGLIDHSHFTRPEVFKEMKVPEVLLSGNHEKIRLWRLKESLKLTLKKRPDLLAQKLLTKEETRLLKEIQIAQEQDSI